MMTNQLDGQFEMTRRLVEWAIAAGRAFQSPQTGFVHYYFSQPNSSVHQTIPLYENLLFALALLRSRVIENIKEAQTLLSRLLSFQNQVEGLSCGNFPFYLHEYPFCRDFSVGISLLAPFYWILKGFGHVLGQELRQRLERSVDGIVQYGLQADQSRSFPYSVAVRFAASLIGLGGLLERADWQQEGEQRVNRLGEHPLLDSWHHTSHLSDLFVALQMAKLDLNLRPWKEFWQFVSQTWHGPTAAYCGPCISERQDLGEPEVNFYDLFMGYLTGRVSHRVQKIKIDHLQAALIHPLTSSFKLEEEISCIQGSYKQHAWLAIRHADWAFTLLAKTLEISERMRKSYTPFRLLWESLNATHSFVCQGGYATRICYCWNDPVAELYFDLEGSVEGSIERSREICFYSDIYPDLFITVEGHRATTFEFGQTVALHLGGGRGIKMTFQLIEGEGQFLGHIAHANRPSQMRQEEDKKSQAYDWTLFLRTLRRSERCRIKATLSWLSRISSES